MPISDSNTTDQYDNTIAVINGQTDNTPIGNVGDRLKVYSDKYYDASNLVYEDMVAISRDTRLTTSFQTLYSYSGSGLFLSALINYDDVNTIYTRMSVDGNYFLFGSSGIWSKDLRDNNAYDLKDIDTVTIAGLGLHDNAVRYAPIVPVKFSSNVLIEGRTSTNKKFKAGFVVLIKES